MKKSAFLFLIIIQILLCTAACGKGNETSADTAKAPTTKETDTTVSEIKREKLKAERETEKALRLLIFEMPSICPVTPCENKQIFNLADYRVREALNAYRAVWKEKTDMFNASTGENQEALKEYLTYIGRTIKHFPILDLDDDGIPEIVLPCSHSNNSEIGIADFYYLLDYRNGQVYYELFSNRQFGHVKIDGTFAWSGGAGHNGFATLSFVEDKQEGTPYTYDCFTYKDYYEQDPETGEWTGYDLIVNHQNVSEAEYEAAWAAEDNKPGVTWHELTEENIIKFSSSPITDSSIPDPPITTAATSIPFAVGAPVTDKQTFDTTDSKVIEALNAYYSALIGQCDFCFFWGAEEPSRNTSVRNINQLKDFIFPRNLKRFAVIDLDNDSIPEVALSSGEYEDNFFIFKYNNGYIYVYELGIRSFNTLKIDGTSCWDSGAFEGGVATISFQGSTIKHIEKVSFVEEVDRRESYINNKYVTKEEEKAFEYQNNKPNAAWYEFSDINIKHIFLLGNS